MKSKVFLIILIFLTLNGSSQNLVKNPSIEEFDNKTPRHWQIISLSPDFYFKDITNSAFSNDKMPFPYGNSFFGLMNSYNNSTSEILQAELEKTLEAGKIYEVKIYASKYSFCPKGFYNVEVAFTDKELIKSDSLKPKIPFVNLYTENRDTLKTKGDWREFSGLYIAKGNEKYISVGKFSNFYKKQPLIKESQYDGNVYADENAKECTYTYFDSLVVCENIIQFNKPIIIKNVFFENNKSILLPPSYEPLNLLYSKLKMNSLIKVKVVGHTDNIGDKTKNLKLSLDRANAVKDYLIKKGIHPKRITTEGLGDKKPIDDNKTEKGRKNNRRVEFEFLN